MDYTIVHFEVANEVFNDILIAELSMLAYDGFEETDKGLKAYIPQPEYNEAVLKELIQRYQTQSDITIAEVELMKAQNWNAVWESNFQPVMIDTRVVVKAPFHQITNPFKHTILLEPQMAFGTGHHETTHMMLQKMLDINMEGKAVLDFGCGTGILAVMAHKLKATTIVAIDNDEQAYKNTLENCDINKAPTVLALLGEEEQIAAQAQQQFDVILANINRNVIIHTFDTLYGVLTSPGHILFSGILHEDIPTIMDLAQQHNLQHQDTFKKGNWAMLCFTKT